nr:hypothetical protein [Ardenticatena sp.]
MESFQRSMTIVARVLFVYVWMTLLAVAVKVLTPFWDGSTWNEILVTIPLGATVAWYLYRFFVRTISAWLEQHRQKS